MAARSCMLQSSELHQGIPFCSCPKKSQKTAILSPFHFFGKHAIVLIGMKQLIGGCCGAAAMSKRHLFINRIAEDVSRTAEHSVSFQGTAECWQQDLWNLLLAEASSLAHTLTPFVVIYSVAARQGRVGDTRELLKALSSTALDTFEYCENNACVRSQPQVKAALVRQYSQQDWDASLGDFARLTHLEVKNCWVLPASWLQRQCVRVQPATIQCSPGEAVKRAGVGCQPGGQRHHVPALACPAESIEADAPRGPELLLSASQDAAGGHWQPSAEAGVGEVGPNRTLATEKPKQTKP